jgi:DNA polymerase delta subunit 1
MTTSSVSFQLLNYFGRDVLVDPEEERYRYKISLFGRDAEGRSVHALGEFDPYFFVELPVSLADSSQFVTDIRNALGRDRRDESGLLMEGLGRQLKYHRVDHRINFFGYQNGAKTKVLLLVFDTAKAKTICASKLRTGKIRDRKFRCFESNLPPELRMIHMCDCECSGWVTVQGKVVPPAAAESNCDVEIQLTEKWSTRTMWPDQERASQTAPFVMASFDIEVFSHDGKFPDPRVKENVIFQIACTFQRFGESVPFKRYIVCLGDHAAVGDDVEQVNVGTEAELIRAWAITLREQQPDVILSWNGQGFDNEYLEIRAKMCGVVGAMRRISKLREHECELITKEFHSSAYGSSVFKYPDTPGMLQFDLLVYWRREYKMDSYKLDNVAEVYLQERKHDVSPKQIFDWWASGDPDLRQKVAAYCVQDTALPMRLVVKHCILTNLMQMSNVTSVPVEYLLFRGQAIKCFSLIARETRRRDLIIPHLEKVLDADYDGATVLEPMRGYHKTPVSCLDFASLYPSIMRAWNLCHSTLVLNEAVVGETDEVFDVQYVSAKTGQPKHFRFVQNKPGVLPDILKFLAKSRSQAKKDMKNAKTPLEKALFNGKQLAYKVSMNSIYGVCGAAVSPLYCPAVSESTTFQGRTMIEQTRDFVLEHYPGTECVYGDTDSVFVNFTKFLEAEGKDPMDMKTVFQISEEAADRCTKIFPNPVELEFEKVYCPLLMTNKKRYAGNMYSADHGPDEAEKIDRKGLTVVRRDSCGFVKKVCLELLKNLMIDMNEMQARATARTAARKLLDGDVPLEELVLSKSLRAQYDNDNQPHVKVAEKIGQRTGEFPKSPERVSFVFVRVPDESMKGFERAEDPAYVREHGLEVDYLYYLEHQLINPVDSLLGMVVPDCKRALFADLVQDLKVRRWKDTKSYQAIRKREADGYPAISSFFRKEAKTQ